MSTQTPLEWLAIGSYTTMTPSGHPGQGSGLTRLGINENLEVIDRIESADFEDCSWLHWDGQLLHLIRESDGDGTNLFLMDPFEAAPWEIIEKHKTGVEIACHIERNPANGRRYVSGYGNGSIATIDQDHGSELTTFSGSSLHPRQSSSHVHQARMSPWSQELLLPDLGMDRLHVLDLEGRELRSITTPPGSGPRHLDFHPTLRKAYLWCELHPFLITLQFSGGQWQMEHTLDLGAMKGFGSIGLASGVRVHSSGGSLALAE